MQRVFGNHLRVNAQGNIIISFRRNFATAIAITSFFTMLSCPEDSKWDLLVFESRCHLSTCPPHTWKASRCPIYRWTSIKHDANTNYCRPWFATVLSVPSRCQRCFYRPKAWTFDHSLQKQFTAWPINLSSTVFKTILILLYLFVDWLYRRISVQRNANQKGL